MRKGCLLLAVVFVTMIVALPCIRRYRGTVEVAERRDENKAFWYVDERYKKIEVGMTLRQVGQILGKGADDGMGETHWWLYKDKIIEMEVVDGNPKGDLSACIVKAIRFPKESELPWNKKKKGS